MKNIVIYVHGNGGTAAEADHYKPLFPDYEVIGFDYRAKLRGRQKRNFYLFLPSRKNVVKISYWRQTVLVHFCLCRHRAKRLSIRLILSPLW